MVKAEKEKVVEARSHLAAALTQVHPTDDKIIVDHIKQAQMALELALYAHHTLREEAMRREDEIAAAAEREIDASQAIR